MHSLSYRLLMVTAILYLLCTGCSTVRKSALYTDGAGKWSLALLPDSTFLMRAVEHSLVEFGSFGQYTIHEDRITLTSAIPSRLQVKVIPRGPRSSVPRVIQVFDCAGKPLNWNQVLLFADSIQLFGNGNVYRCPQGVEAIASLKFQIPSSEITFEPIALAESMTDTIDCIIPLPGIFLHSMRPLVVQPAALTLKVTPTGLANASITSAVNGPVLPAEWFSVNKLREKRQLFQRLPSLLMRTCH